MSTEKRSGITTTQPRIPFIDSVRGFAILLMMIFHLCYDLYYFKFLTVDFNGPFWEWFRYVIISLFFLVSGFSTTQATKNGINRKKYGYRFGQVLVSALIITSVTYVLFPNAWIYFGVLHFFALSMIAVLPFRKTPLLSLLLGILIFILFNTTGWFNLSPLYNWLQPIIGLPRGTQDLTRFIPWFGMILIGSSLAHYGIHPLIYLGQQRGLSTGWHIRLCTFLGRHPLKIYLLHQPLLFGLIYIARLIN